MKQVGLTVIKLITIYFISCSYYGIELRCRHQSGASSLDHVSIYPALGPTRNIYFVSNNSNPAVGENVN